MQEPERSRADPGGAQPASAQPASGSVVGTWGRIRQSRPVAGLGQLLSAGASGVRVLGQAVTRAGPAVAGVLTKLVPGRNANAVAPHHHHHGFHQVKCINLARCFAPCLRPNGQRRRVRFGGKGRKLHRTSMLLDDEAVASDGSALSPTVAATGAALAKPVYLQVRCGRGLISPTFEGATQSCYCVLLVGGHQRGCTHQVACISGSTAQWNEVFTLPRKPLEAASGRVVLQVWCLDSYLADDVLVGQAELPLAAMLAAERPHPVAATLVLQAIDEDTGQVEPGSCGELVVAAWVEAAIQEPPACRIAAAVLPPGSMAPPAAADLDEVGVVKSTLEVPCGNKPLPQVLHGPLGTLYEEPCIALLRVKVVSLIDLNYDLLQQNAQQGGIKRRVRLEGRRAPMRSITSVGGDSAAGGVGAGGGAVVRADTSVTPGSGGPAAGGAAAGAAGRKRSVADRLMRRRQQQQANAVGMSMDEEDMEGPVPGEEDDAPGAGANGVGVDGRSSLMDELDEIASSSLPTGGIGSVISDDSGAGAQGGAGGSPPGVGPGTYYYFKVAVDKQSHKGRMRWLSATAATSLAANGAVVTPLQLSTFLFVLARPLPNCPVTLALYATPSVRRRGRVVARTTVALYDLLDHLLRTTGVSQSLVSNGKPCELDLPFEDEELGCVRVSLQLADTDHRPLLYRVPLVEDPSQLQQLDQMGGGAATCAPPILQQPTDPQQLAAAAAALAGAPPPAAVGIKDQALLSSVLCKAGVDPAVEAMFRLTGNQEEPRVWSVAGSADGGVPVSHPTYYQVPPSPNQANSESSLLLPMPSMTYRAAVTAVAGGAALPPSRAALLPPPGLGAAAATAGGVAAAAAAAQAALPQLRCPLAEARRQSLGSVAVRIKSLNSSGVLSGSHCCVIKCGPHWLRTGDRQPHDVGTPQWQAVFPLYDPATTLTIGIFSVNSKSVIGLTWNEQVTLVSKVRLKLSTVAPNKSTWHAVTLTTPGPTSSSRYRSDGGGLGSVGTASGPGGAGATAAPVVAVVGVKLRYRIPCLLGSYLAAARPESLYELDLDGSEKLKMNADSLKIAESWLASAQPPIPPLITRALTDEGRTQFDWARTKANLRRVQEGWRAIAFVAQWFRGICSWQDRQASWEVVVCILLLCYFPSTAMQLFMYMLALVGLKRYWAFRRYLASKAAAQGADPLVVVSPAAAGGTGAHGSGGNAGEAVDDDGVDVPVGTMAELRRKYDSLLELGLIMQNYLDDIASVLEKLQAVLSFKDLVASWLFIGMCAALLVLFHVLGFSTTMAAVLLWQVRPPALQDALPPPPVNYFMRLPCNSPCDTA